MMIFSKHPQRDNIEIMLARKCGFYIRGKQQGLAEDEISMPILMTQTLHEMLVHFADEVRTITKAVYDVEIEPLKARAIQAENIALEQQSEITTLRARVKELESGGWINVEDRLPSDDCRVLAATWVMFNGEQMVEISSFNSGGVYFSDKVTHWQPLPEPPKD